jgi:hypothetical protein
MLRNVYGFLPDYTSHSRACHRNTEIPPPLLEFRETMYLTTKAEVSQELARNFTTGEVSVELVVKFS